MADTSRSVSGASASLRGLRLPKAAAGGSKGRGPSSRLHHAGSTRCAADTAADTSPASPGSTRGAARPRRSSGRCLSPLGFTLSRVTVVEAVARARVGGGRSVEQFACHPRLPLVAGLDSERPVVHVWRCEAGHLRELGSVGAESAGYGDAIGWDRMVQTPAVACIRRSRYSSWRGWADSSSGVPPGSPSWKVSRPPLPTGAWPSARAAGRRRAGAVCLRPGPSPGARFGRSTARKLPFGPDRWVSRRSFTSVP